MSATDVLAANDRSSGERSVERACDARSERMWRARPGYLFHPWVDFLLAGGASIPCALFIFFALGDTSVLAPKVLAFTSALQIFVNYPHFAHSYQLLYSGYVRRILSAETDRLTRLRYLWAGLVAPTLLVGFFAYAAAQEDARVLAYAVNGMAFFVGWHYVKQGYGVLIVLSVLRKIYFTTLEKRILLVNAYAVWLCGWLQANEYLAEDRRWGLTAWTFDMPDTLVVLGKIAAGLTSALLVLMLVRRVVLTKKPISVNGLVGYGCAIYLWLLAAGINLVFLYLIPAFHSLQYLLFVWRFQLNKTRAEPGRWASRLMMKPKVQSLAAFGTFVLAGGILGWLGFVGVPRLLDATVAYDPRVWSAALFVFIFTMFINVHHYFIDNVIWRKENDEVRRFLFAS